MLTEFPLLPGIWDNLKKTKITRRSGKRLYFGNLGQNHEIAMDFHEIKKNRSI